jgi:hypothetical protein
LAEFRLLHSFLKSLLAAAPVAGERSAVIGLPVPTVRVATGGELGMTKAGRELALNSQRGLAVSTGRRPLVVELAQLVIDLWRVVDDLTRILKLFTRTGKEEREEHEDRRSF